MSAGTPTPTSTATLAPLPVQAMRNAKVISVINMKGGVGKTLLSANVFRELHVRKQKRVLLIDFDPQYNLSQLLLSQMDYMSLKSANKTLFAIMDPPTVTSVFQTATEDLLDVGDVESYTHCLNVASPGVELNLIAGDFELAKINLRENPVALRFPRIRFRNFIQEAKKLYDLIVLDCNPSTSFLSRAALEVSSHLVVPIRPDRYSVLGAEMLLEFMNMLPTMEMPPKQIMVVNGVRGQLAGPEKVAVEELRADPSLGPQTLVSAVPFSDVLKARPDYAGFAADRGVPYAYDIKLKLGQVADELAQKLGL